MSGVVKVEAMAVTASGNRIRMPEISLDPSGSTVGQESNDVMDEEDNHYEWLRHQRHLEEWLEMGVFTFRWSQVPQEAVQVGLHKHLHINSKLLSLTRYEMCTNYNCRRQFC